MQTSSGQPTLVGSVARLRGRNTVLRKGPTPASKSPKKMQRKRGGGVQDFATCSAEQVPKLRVWVFLRRFRRLLTATSNMARPLPRVTRAALQRVPYLLRTPISARGRKYLFGGGLVAEVQFIESGPLAFPTAGGGRQRRSKGR